jgi:hypothetical protein
VDKNVTIARVGAVVDIDGRERVSHGPAGDVDPDLDQLSVDARLFAETAAGDRLTVFSGSMGAGMPRRGIAAIWKRYSGPPLPEDPEAQRRGLERYRVQRQDVEDAINQSLGRDPEQHKPPRLSWGPLIELLAQEGISMSEEQLIATPFVFEFSDQLLAELSPQENER